MAAKKRRGEDRPSKWKRSPKAPRSSKPAGEGAKPLLSMTRQGLDALRARVGNKKDAAAFLEALKRLDAEYQRVLKAK